MPPKRNLKRKISATSTSKQDSSSSKNQTKKECEEEESSSAESERKVAKNSTVYNATSYNCWLVKSEPNSRIEKSMDMKARNFLRDHMKLGHNVFFYHSNCKEPGIIGICKVVRESYPDDTQFDPKNPHFDSKSVKKNPKWYMVDVKFERPLSRFISLAELKKLHQEHVQSGGPLAKLGLFTKPRLSVQPVTEEEWSYILQLEKKS